jgi:hypothetical protein
MKKIFSIFLLLFFSVINLYAQKLHLSEIINAVYSNGHIVDDTLYFVSPGESSCISTLSRKDSAKIIIKTFKSVEELSAQLTSGKNNYLLSATITEIALGRLTMNIEINKTNKDAYSGAYHLVSFYDERRIECVYLVDRKLWVYDTTISVKKHITD